MKTVHVPLICKSSKALTTGKATKIFQEELFGRLTMVKRVPSSSHKCTSKGRFDPSSNPLGYATVFDRQFFIQCTVFFITGNKVLHKQSDKRKLKAIFVVLVLQVLSSIQQLSAIQVAGKLCQFSFYHAFSKGFQK